MHLFISRKLEMEKPRELGNVTGNIMALVKSLGDAGLVGLIALGVILWLFSSRKMA